MPHVVSYLIYRFRSNYLKHLELLLRPTIAIYDNTVSVYLAMHVIINEVGLSFY